MKTFTVNGKEYPAKDFDFNMVCDLEDQGVSLEEAGKKPMSFIRAYFGLCSGRGKEFAGKELEAHILDGGTFDSISNVMSEKMDESDFFRNLSKKAETETAADQEQTGEKAQNINQSEN